MEIPLVRSLILVLLGCAAALAQESRTDPTAVARRFMPPNAELAEIYTFDYDAGKVRESRPAVLTGHILRPDTDDIVFAYYSPQIQVLDKTLFVDLLRSVGKDYEKVYEISYRSQVLFVPSALQIIHLPGAATDGVAVMAGIGAALGGHLDVLLWQEPSGWQNIFPPNGSMEYFYFFPTATGLKIALSAARHRGKSGLPSPDPPPLWFRWDGTQFAGTQKPVTGKSK